MAALKFIFQLSLCSFLFVSCSLFKPDPNSVVDELIVMPNVKGPVQIISGIEDAKKSIWMKMYHLTNQDVVKALIDAHKRKVSVKIILDSASLSEDKFKKAFDSLKVAGIDVRSSSTCYSITHEKSLIVDAELAFITSINLTQTYAVTRDFGVITSNQEVIKEMKLVFLADWKNAEENTCQTPALATPSLLWSPNNSEDRIVTLIRAAKDSISGTVENLGNKKILDALIEKVSQGVKVKLIVPQCDKNRDPLFNYPFIFRLANASVEVRVMPFPATYDHPYMHSKMLLIDDGFAYVGSINFSNNSLLRARELGIIFNDEGAIKRIAAEFNHDWRVSIAPVPLKRDFCPELN